MKYILLTLILLSSLALHASIKIVALQCEGRENPVGVGAPMPRFSWQMVADGERDVKQIAYQILVATTPERLNEESADVWNSGYVENSVSRYIDFKGKKLQSSKRYYWLVKVQTNTGKKITSSAATWVTGLFSENDWKGRWIGVEHSFPGESETQFSRLAARYLRQEFECNKEIAHATVHISGMGLYELYFNGQKVGNDVLAPVPTDYRRSVMYNSYDVTKLLTEGKNAVGVILGNGRFYTMRQAYKPYKIPTFGYPKMRMTLVLEYTDGSTMKIGSDEKWRLTANGPILSNNEYDGEDYDARKELTGWNTVGYDDSGWQTAERTSIPLGTLTAQPCANMKVCERIKPVSIKQVEGGVWQLDMGQNMSGWLRIRVQGSKGDTITLRFAELLKDGRLYTENLRDAKCTDHYILKGDKNGEEWAPRFTYHGFRYAEVKGFKGTLTADNIIGEFVRDDMPITGQITTSDTVLNNTLRNAWWGIASNYKGMPIDCPQRNERQPWLGDHATGFLGESYFFDCELLYAKWMDDIREAQRADGCIPDVAPAYWNYYSDNVTWPSAFILISDMIYTQYGNDQPIKKNFSAMKLWINHIGEYMENGLISRDKYGDWCVPPESLDLIHSKDTNRRTDGTLIATAYYYQMLQLMHKFAKIAGEDGSVYAERGKVVLSAFNKKFLNKEKGYYGNNTVTANILPLAFRMVPKENEESVIKNLVDVIIVKNNGLISTGVIGGQWLMRTLTAIGRSDIATALTTTTKYPSWGYMQAQGATTIWELWNGNTAIQWMNSGNHVMLLGDLVGWAYQDLAGIRGKEGFQEIYMSPAFSQQEINSVSASYESPYGKIVSNWTKTQSSLSWHISVPANATALIDIPAEKAYIKENGVRISTVKGIKYRGKTLEGGGTRWELGSGNYDITANLDVAYGKWRKGIVADEFLYEKTSFPECHASTLAETPTGLVAAFFGGTKERNPDCCVWVCRKTNDGWTEPQKVAEGTDDSVRYACWNPVLFQVPGGELLLFYKTGPNVAKWKGHLVRSKDNGVTWSKPEHLPDGFIGPVKNKPIMIGSRMICPSSMEGDGWKVHFEMTEDLGKTWRKVGPLEAEEALPSHLLTGVKDDTYDQEGGGAVVAEKGKYVIQSIQPGIIAYPDGRLQILCRSRNCYLSTSWSSDQGETWSSLALSNIPNNNSGTDAMMLADGRAVLVYNHVRTPDGAKKGLRTPLNVALSKDGKTWYKSLVLEDSPVSQYSYPSVLQTSDGKVHFIYTWRRQRIKHVSVDPKKMEMIEEIVK